MIRVQRENGSTVHVLRESLLLGSGGEAKIYNLAEDWRLVAKLWHKPRLDQAAKVRAMLLNKPTDPSTDSQHVSIAWPHGIITLMGCPTEVVGFVMPKVSGMRPMLEFYNPKTRREKCPFFTYSYLIRTARNLAVAVRALHERGYVIGDLNESNVLVSPTALVTVVDTDSFQVWDPQKQEMHRCRVGKPELTPREMQGVDFTRQDRTEAQDLFGLGALIHMLLLEGTHPFAGICRLEGEPPTYVERIAAGHYPFAGRDDVPYGPSPLMPSYDILSPAIRDLFFRCFHDGHHDATLRPDANSWRYAIEEMEQSLVTCSMNGQHAYPGHLEQCPWCLRAKALGGRDPFPSRDDVRQAKHLRPAPKRKPTLPDNAVAASYTRQPGSPPPVRPQFKRSWRPRQRRVPPPNAAGSYWVTKESNSWAWAAVGIPALGWLIGRNIVPIALGFATIGTVVGIYAFQTAFEMVSGTKQRALAWVGIILSLMLGLWGIVGPVLRELVGP